MSPPAISTAPLLARLVALCVLGAWPAGAAPLEARPPRLVLLYATCSLARSAISPYNEAVPYTPRLEAFARESLVFDRHHTEAGQSGIAFASLFTGTQQALHGVYSHPSILPERNLVLAERFAAAGYETHSWLEHPMANADLGYAQGVPEARQHPERLDAGDPEFLQLIESLAADPNSRALVTTNFTVTHAPYRGEHLGDFCRSFPDRCWATRNPKVFRSVWRFYVRNHLSLAFDFEASRERFKIDDSRREQLGETTHLLYETNTRYLDSLFGAVLDRIAEAGLADESLVIFTTDHGEIADRPNAPFKWTHGFQQAPEVLVVPLIIRGPSFGIEPGRYTAVTQSIDVAPSVEGLSQLGPRPPVTGSPDRAVSDPRFRGRDLSAAIRGISVADDAPAYTHTGLVSARAWVEYKKLEALASRYPEPTAEFIWASMREDDRWWTLRRPPGGPFAVSLYDLEADPGLEHDRFDAAVARHAAAAERLRSYKAELVDAFADPGHRALPVESAEEAERLRALGYIE